MRNFTNEFLDSKSVERGVSQNTIMAYNHDICQYIEIICPKQVEEANYEDIEKEWQFQRNIPMEENSFINEYYDISREDFNAALNTMIEQSKGINLPEGYVPQTVFYLWNDEKIIGTFHLRHYLCESLVNGSGHIGYYIAHEYRGRGYATNIAI